MKKNPDHIHALKILLEKPSDFTTDELTELRQKLSKRPERFTEKNLRKAYHNELADIISIVRHAGKGEPLLSAKEHVARAMAIVKEGKKFTPKQEDWLNLIENHLVENLVIDSKRFRLSSVFKARFMEEGR